MEALHWSRYKTGLILRHPVIHCTVMMLLHATQKIVAMEFAKVQVWLFDNVSSCIFYKKNSYLNILTIQWNFRVWILLYTRTLYKYVFYACCFQSALVFSYDYLVVHLLSVACWVISGIVCCPWWSDSASSSKLCSWLNLDPICFSSWYHTALVSAEQSIFCITLSQCSSS